VKTGYKRKKEGMPCVHSMVRPQVVDGGESLQIWRVATNILNKQFLTATRGGPLA
jgi:hypothetical protein